MLWATLFTCQCLLIAAQGPGPGRRRSLAMQSRAVDTRVQLEVAEGLPRNTLVGSIPTRPGFTYRFNEPPSEFALDAVTGAIRTTTVLDRESFRSDRFDLVVLSSQPTYPIEVRIVVTDINDNAPEFLEPSISVTFSESAAAGTRFLLDSAFDRDLGPNGVSDDYRIVAGNKDEKFRLVVTSNPSGETSYLHLETTGKLDRETRALYILNISARDGGTPPLFGYLQVNVTVLDVNDNPPMFDHSDYNVSLNESVVPGTSVLQVMATDIDIGDNARVTYYLEDLGRQFAIDPETGIITTTEPLSCVEQQNCSEPLPQGGCPRSCVISVSAWDHGSPRQVGRAYVTVNLIQVNANNHDPIINFTYFLRPAKFATVDENAANGSVVAAVTVVDLDEGLNGETIVVIKAGNELNHFRLDSTPAVRVNGILDREEISKYNLTIVASDRGNPPRSSSASLIIYVNDVNDHEPVFEKSEYSAVLSELSPPGTYVAGTTATDADTGVNAHIYYAFVSGNERNWFEMNTDSGLITTKSTIDREIQGSVELKISARDGGPNPKWAYTQLKLTILDENDEAPKFSQNSINVTLSESTPINTLVAMLTAADHDQGTNGSVAYFLVPDPQHHHDETFALDSLTGQLTTRVRLDRERVASYNVRVVARDQGVPPQSSTAVVHVTVEDVNDNSPAFYPLKYFTPIREDLPKGNFALQVFAHDLDEGKNAELRYSITSGGDGIFHIDERTGMISLKNALLSSSKALYRLKISVKDMGGRTSDEEAIVEFIKDNLVQDLEFDSYNGYEFKVMEDHGDKDPAIGTEVGRIQVRAGEYRGNKDDLQYHIVVGDSSKRFQINERSGVITTANRIDRETTQTYSLICIARANLWYGKTTINITVLDLNDNKPLFDVEKDFVSFPENSPVGHEVYHALARDIDSGVNSRVRYSLTMNADDLFRINAGTGVVYLSKPMQKESGSVLNIQITATDYGEPPLSSKQSVVITVQDVNDHTPVFDHTSYETSLLESTAVNNRFFRLAASDADLGDNGLISYSIVEGNTEDKFGVFPDGYLYVKSPLDRETKDYYSLLLMAEDRGKPPRSSTVPLVVHVIDENDNSPQFTNTTFTFHISENEPPDSFVGKLTALDGDIGRNAELTFSFSNVQNEFVIDPKNGFIKSISIFDREALVEKTGKSYVSLEAVVNDNGLIRLKDKVTVIVYIDDENDNSPIFLKTPYKMQISESAAIGVQVLKIYTSDADEGVNGDVFYSIHSGNDGKKFSIDVATGQISLNKELDREERSRYVLTVTAYDGALTNPLSATTTVVIDVLDENDNAPVFSQSEAKVSVVETATVGTKLSQFQATDSDLGVNSEVSFSIESGNRRDTFQMDPSTGIISLHKLLDYEELSMYTLTVVASDGGNPRLSSTTVFTVAVEDSNDNPPAFPNTAIVRQIREGIPVNTPIVTVTAEDPDSGDNGQVRYTIASQDPENSKHDRHFGINPVTGVIHTLLPIDREAVDTFRLTVVATDQAAELSARMSAEKLVTVIVEDINDNAPHFVSMNAAVLPLDARDGPLIMHVFARDFDSNTNGLVTYELVGGSAELFKLHRSTGALSLRRGVQNLAPMYRLAVKATDEAVQSERKSTETYITLAARGEAPVPIFARTGLAGTVLENEPPGTSVLSVAATLPGSSLEYLVTNVTGDGAQVDRLFDVDGTGVLSTSTALDREAGPMEYEVEIYAVSTNTTKPHIASTKVRVTVLDKNDSPPSFRDTQLEFSVSEDLPASSVVGTIRATDPDTLGQLRYQLLSGGGGHFLVEPNTGVLRLNDSLDREDRDFYRLVVRAHDGVQYADAAVKITVTDTNDNPPVFSEPVYSFDVAENTPRGTRVGEVLARDDDLAVNGQVSYQVVSDWANDVFSLNPQTGVFTLTSRLDYEDVQHYIFVVQAHDMGKPSLSSTLTVYFNVVDLNDNAPLFDPMSYSDEVFENVTAGTSVVTVSATDMDSGANGVIDYSITAGDDEGMFSIAQNGTIVTTRGLDRETKSLYNLVVTASDMATPPQPRLSATVQVTIVLKDVNDMSAEFMTPNETSVMENIPPSTVVLAIKAVDRDEGRNSYLEYSLGGPGPFSLGPVDGLLRVTGRLDREARASYVLEVTARDRGDPPRASRQTILVTVFDENDNSPVFDPKHYSASVPENASIGVSVLQVSATDVDEGSNGRVRYSIVAGDENRDFSISEDSGVVRVAKNLNFERKARYVLNVRAEDSAVTGTVRYDTATISIAVADINDNPPTFLDSPYLALVMENVVPPGGFVLTVRAYDADTPPYNAQVRYFLKEGDAGLFRMNASTGAISLLRALDREAQAEYLLTLHAMDTGTPPLTGTGTVRIVVQDVNDHSPVFSRHSYSATVVENTPVGTVVLQAVATDQDEGLNAKIRYSLLGEDSERFMVDEDTGRVTVADILDREQTASYFLSMVAQDCSATDPRATAVNLTINVQDENDNAPRFSSARYTVHVPDGTQAGQFVFGAKAFDEDDGPNSLITYSLSGSDASSFTISPKTGAIAAATQLSFDNLKDRAYYLEVLARDGGTEALSAKVEVTVKLWPGQQFPTINAPMERHFTLPENVEAGRIITTISAASPKPGPSGKIRFAIAGGNVGEALRIDSKTGQVFVAGGGLDFETNPLYEVWVEARDSDSPPLGTVLQLLVNVTDANDNAPVLDQAIFNASIYEEEYPPQSVIVVTATDADSGENGRLSFSLLDDVDGSFSIDESTGEISTESKLDREKMASYSLTVLAIDHGTPRLTGTSLVQVNVLDKNDNYPKFTRLFSVNVTENSEPGTFVIRVTSSDQDVGDNANATYSLTENPGEHFTIHPLTGNVTVTGPLDRELQDEYLLKVEAFDGAWRAETPLTITIQDQNDNAPEFEHSYYNFNFPELQTNVVFVGQVTATDRDKHGPNSLISYSLKHPSDLFTVDPASGELFSKRSLRYKYTAMGLSPENQYTLSVLATDNGKPPMSSECMVTVNVVDANNSPPKFTHQEYSGPLPATSRAGLKVLQVKASDSGDCGVNAEVEYQIVGGNGSDLFKINKDSGWITLVKPLSNPRLLTRYSLQLVAVDRGAPPLSARATAVLIVTGENLYAPAFAVLSSQVIIPENDPIGSVILTVAATDDDDGPNGIVRYAISSGNEDGKFALNSKTGALTILEPLDYDEVNEYHLNITASDKGFEPMSATAIITIALTDVNDNPPKFNQSVYKAYIPENSPIATPVFRVEAHDADSPKNAVVEYSIVRGSGKDLFAIQSRTGQITSTSRLDFEEKNVYVVEVLAANPDSSMTGATKVIIYVTGVNEFYPKFVRPVFHFDASESSEVGTSVGAVQATDADDGDDGKVFYLLVGSSNDRGFSIGHDTGVISVARRLDRETQSRVVLTVIAKNAGSIRGNDTDEAQVIISVQDGNDPPEFAQSVYQVSVSEAVRPGTRVLVVTATDTDVRPQNNQFSFSIISGNTDKAFKIDPQNGEIETTVTLDRETIPSYVLTVGAIDVGVPPQTGTATVKIVLEDVNDNGPVFDLGNLAGYVTENEPPNTSVMTLVASDPDLPPNGGPFSYYLVGGKHRKFVQIEKDTGIVRTTKSIDRESTPLLDVVVEVEDSGSPRLKSQHSLQITILDQNDSPSSPRTVQVLVYHLAGAPLPGKIADVHPNDADTTGDYQCKVVHTAPPAGLRVRHGCELSAESVSVGVRYSLTVSGNDGRHADVTSQVFVEFFTFDNVTIDNSFTVRVENMTGPKFLTHHFKNFIGSLTKIFDVGVVVQLLSIHEVDSGLELTLAIKRDVGYVNKGTAVERLARSRDALQQVLETTVTVGYSPCQKTVCENGGGCTDGIRLSDETRITDSQTVVFTSPVVTHDFTCRCPDGFTGKLCEKRHDPCLPNPCHAGGVCRRQGYEFTCSCPPERDGKVCELERGDACDGNPCRNGGSCRQSPDRSSFFCLCRPGYRGNHCETVADSCRPNPCLHGGLCVSLKPGYRCSCPEARYGRHCEKATFGFGELSFMTFPPLDVTTNDISVIFATTKPDSLLVYNYGAQTGGRSDFVAVELVSGRAVFSYGGARSAITSVSVPRGNSSLATGSWHKLTATRNGRVISLSVAACADHGDSCHECRAGDASCFADDIGPIGTLNFNNQPMLVGGLASADPLLERPGQVHSDDFVGCIHSLSVNGRSLNLSNPLRSQSVSPTCGRARAPCAVEGEEAPCGAGRCMDRWNSHHCQCGSLWASNCGDALSPVTLTDGAFLEFKVSEKHARMQLLDNIYHGSTQWVPRSRWRRFAAATSHGPTKSFSLMFRTVRKDGLLFYTATNRDFTSLELMDGQLVYASHAGVTGPTVNMTVAAEASLADGAWHNVTVVAQARGLQLLLDGLRVGDELDAAGVHDPLDAYLTTLSIGGVRKENFHSLDGLPKGFEGCIANFTINNEVQSLNGSGSIFPDVVAVGVVTRGCAGPVGIGATAAPDPLSIGVTLVIVFFVTLLVAILVSFIVFHLRRQKKEKGGAPVGRGGKQNGGATLVAGGGGLVGGGDVLSRGMHGEANVGFLSEGGDVIRGHHLVAPELISKKYKEREIHNTDTTRHPRPDIIEREVVSKSPPLRDDHHPPLPPNVQDDIPEHYDLENASSIAPSDIDIVYHYKGYRDGGMRKYKATPPHIPASSYHHKHGGATPQHRHTAPVLPPPSRDSPRSLVPPPPGGNSQPSNKCTPLARLSPSSELSSQQPRILTLSDISGKPLQSALLATTSSSGGVGKDVLHSNSERSLNSPVMSQLSGQSSSASRKNPTQGEGSAGKGPVPMGLTTEEIERFNCRSSSLVSTLDAVSSSSEARRQNAANIPDNHSSTSTDESGNDSFTCSEIEYDNNSLTGCKLPDSSSAATKPPVPPAYDGFDSSFRGSLSTLVASDDDLSTHMGGLLYRPPNGSPSSAAALGWDYLLNWGPNFESLVGVFKDIAELPDAVNGRVQTLRLPSQSPKPSEEYV